MTDWKSIQKRLLDLGYVVGPLDGIPGRLTTQAVAKFQADRKLPIKYPGTVGAITLSALFPDHPSLSVAPVPVWIDEARRFYGLHERQDATKLDKALGLRAREISWCGAFVGMVMASTLPNEPLPANPLGARNWMKFGEALLGPQVGAVAVFWRGTRDGWQGHVGFVVGHDKTHLHILGGNQSDAVTIARIAKDRLLGYRWPISAPPAPTTRMAETTINASVTTNEA